jgi:RNA polymerase sigma-70 factor, ECF subfamily
VTEDEFLAAARGGDQHAFAELLDAHDRPLRILAYRVLGNRDDMDDAMQEAAVKAFVNLGSFNGRSSFGTWLYRITYTTCLNQLRARRAVAEPVDLEQADQGPVRGGGGGGVAAAGPVHDPASCASERLDLEEALRSLSDEHRAAVCLVLELGYPLAEAAGILEVPVGTVSSRLWHARAALQRSLDPPSTVRGGDGGHA